MTNEVVFREALAAVAADQRDEDAWRKLFRFAWPFMVAVCTRLLGGDSDLGQEAAQQSLVRLFRYAPFQDLLDPSAFRAYARTVCRRVVHAHYRERGARAMVPEVDSELLVSDDLDPEQQADARLLLETIVANLDPESRRLLRMTAAGYSLKEIADKFEITYDAAGVRVHRLRKQLRKWLRIS